MVDEVMRKFSERVGAVQPSTEIQINGMNNELRTSLWNLVILLYGNKDLNYWKNVCITVARGFRKSPVDELPYQDYECREWLKEYLYGLQWYQVYDLLEFIVDNHWTMTQTTAEYGRNHTHVASTDDVIGITNRVLERELSGYRFIARVLTPVATPVEVAAIEDALNEARTNGLQGAHTHLHNALQLLGKKPDPDYRNSIKESISAVESVAKLISGKTGGGLEGALTRLAKAADIHEALKSGFLKLYGYTSNEDGIRHAILEERTVGYAEAKYMVVACSAFVGYLITKADDANLLKKE